MYKLTTIALIVAILPIFAVAQSGDSLQPPLTPTERHDKYVQLNRQILARHDDEGSGALNQTKVKFEAATEQLHQMISEEIQLALAAPKPSEAAIAAAISQLEGDFTLSGWYPETNTPFAKLFTLNNIPALAVGYVIVRGGDAIPDTRAYLEFYDKSSATWERRATAPTLTDFPQSSFDVAQINSGVPGEAWFLAWGIPTGNSRASEWVWLYGFDGLKVRTVWHREHLEYGKITVKPDSVALEYEDESLPDGTAREVLHVTPNGLE